MKVFDGHAGHVKVFLSIEFRLFTPNLVGRLSGTTPKFHQHIASPLKDSNHNKCRV
jgi:hypothetical protein